METISKNKAALYRQLVEETSNVYLINYMQDEAEFIGDVLCQKKINAVDLGAGYGRVLPVVTSYAERVYAIENDVEMYSDLIDVAGMYENVVPLFNDISRLPQVLPDINKHLPLVFLLCQNTLGVVRGQWQNVIAGIKIVSSNQPTELILSVLRQQALQDFGIPLYEGLVEMVGVLDHKKSKVEDGLFISDEGYISKWWNDKEIQAIVQILNGRVIKEEKKDNYWLLHIKI